MKRLTAEQRRMVEANIRLVSWFCALPRTNWLVRMFPSWEDAIQQATIGLCDAARSWRPERLPFASYAACCMFNAMYNAMRRQIACMSLRGRPEPVAFCELQYTIADKHPDADPADRDWADDSLTAILRFCSPRQKQVAWAFVACYGSIKAAAALIGVSRARVHEVIHQIGDRARANGFEF